MTSENLRTWILKEYELGLISDNELSNLLMDFAMKFHKEQCNITDVVVPKGALCECEYPIIRQDLTEYCSICQKEVK